MATPRYRPPPVGSRTIAPSAAIPLLEGQVADARSLLEARTVAVGPFRTWETCTKGILERAFGENHATVDEVMYAGKGPQFSGMSEQDYDDNRRTELVAKLETIAGLLQLLRIDAACVPAPVQPPLATQAGGVFIVHGHDQRRHELEVLLRKLDLQVTVLADEPNRGQTVIEKLESSSNCAFAVVLVTGDDEGRLAATPTAPLRPRARQNVILELGYFMARLGRSRVCALYEPGVEIPSDYAGVLFVELDAGSAWHFKLGKELKAAGLAVDMNKL